MCKQENKSASVVSTDFETAIQKAGCGKFNIFMLMIAMPAACTSSFATGTMSYVIPVAGHDLGLTASTKALLQSASYIGMISSAILWGAMSDALGRQRLLAYGFLLDFVMNTLCALIPTLPTIVLFKILSGAIVCGPHSICITYISEVFLEKRRTVAVLSVGLFSHTGSILQSCMALFLIPAVMPDWLPMKSWQVFILICGLPSLLAGIGFIFTVESPKFLVEKGRQQKALDVFKTIYTINTGNNPDQYPVRKIHQPPQAQPKTSVKEKIVLAAAIFRRPYLFRLLLVSAMQFSLVSGMNTLRLWLPEMLTVMSSASTVATNETLCPLLAEGHRIQTLTGKVIAKQDTYFDMMIINVSCLASHVFFMVLVTCLSKKNITMGVSVIAASCAAMIPHVNPNMIFIPSAIMIASLNSGFYAAIGLTVEIFPTCVRATSVSILMMLGRVGILSANFIFINLIYTYCELVFYILSGLSGCILLVCLFLSTTPIPAPEPKITPRSRHTTQ